MIVQWLLVFGVPRCRARRELFSCRSGCSGHGRSPGRTRRRRVVAVLQPRAVVRARGRIVLMIVAVSATRRIVHESIAGAGMGMLLYISPIPFLSLALVVWAVATRRLTDGARRASLVAAIVLACAPWTLLRTDGVGGAGSEFHWRWTPTPEQRLLAQASDEPKPLPPPPAPAETPKEPSRTLPRQRQSNRPLRGAENRSRPLRQRAVPARAACHSERLRRAEWPGFRGPERDSVIRGVRIETDWSASPPVQMWRRPIGPGWSSFAVQRRPPLHAGAARRRRDRRLLQGVHRRAGVATPRPVRFWESNGGAGPRATPTLSNGRVYAFGATGILNALDAGDRRRRVVAQRRVRHRQEGPGLGLRQLAAGGRRHGDRRRFRHAGRLRRRHRQAALARPLPRRQLQLAASGDDRRRRPDRAARRTGRDQRRAGRRRCLWEHAWSPGAIVQPALTADGDILINAIASTGGIGTRRLAVTHGSGGWSVEERWTSNGLKPYFNDFVIHKGHAFGFDGSILACIDLEDGKRKWKGGRYGNGQLVLLPDQDLLLVLSEEGELALVSATPDKFTELARFQALDGKTWNHPVLVGDVLLVRNGEEMAAFRLSLAGR